MNADVASDYDPSEAGPVVECRACAPGHVTRTRPMFTDDRAGRIAHAKAFGHYPRTETDRETETR